MLHVYKVEYCVEEGEEQPRLPREFYFEAIELNKRTVAEALCDEIEEITGWGVSYVEFVEEDK